MMYILILRKQNKHDSMLHENDGIIKEIQKEIWGKCWDKKKEKELRAQS